MYSHPRKRPLELWLIALFTISTGYALSAQEYTSAIEIGLLPAAIATIPVGALTTINGSTPCADEFASQLGVNPGVSLWGSYAFSRDSLKHGFRISAIRIRAGYADMSSQFEATPQEQHFSAFDDINNRFVDVETRHTADFKLTYLQSSIALEMAFGPAFLTRIGPSISIPLSGTSSEDEEIVTPANATFLDRRQKQNIPEGSGSISDLGLRLGIGVELSYRLPLGKNIFFEPTLGLDYGVTNVQPDWSPLLLNAGIAVGIRFPSQPPVPQPQPIAQQPVVRTEPVTPAPAPQTPFTGDIDVAAIAPNGPIEFRREIVARYVPLLPSVFFEKNSSTLSEQYVQISSDRAREFAEQQIAPDAESAHRSILNIVGRRLQDNPGVRVTLIGTSSSDEEARPQMTSERIRTIAEYLRTTWGISSDRIVAEPQRSSQVRSNEEYQEGREENRRVEIQFSKDEMFAPLQQRVIEPVTDPERIEFGTRTVTSKPVDHWELRVGNARETKPTVTGQGAVPETLAWNLTTEDREEILSRSTTAYQLMLYDDAGRTITTQPKTLPVRRDTSVSVTTSNNTPLNAAEFLLITFDFDRAELTPRGRSDLKAIRERIGPASEVQITGYTDRLGDEAHNRALADARARQIASLLPQGTKVEARGAGPEEAPYSNETPAGRFLNRTVRVVIRNPK
jgi:outer membrane protein OmpA-like peptidoglycan-associated protein